MYFAYFLRGMCVTLLWAGIILLCMREILPLFGKYPSVLEKTTRKCTEPLWLMADALCRMAGIPTENGGIEMRYVIAKIMLAFALAAVNVWQR